MRGASDLFSKKSACPPGDEIERKGERGSHDATREEAGADLLKYEIHGACRVTETQTAGAEAEATGKYTYRGPLVAPMEPSAPSRRQSSAYHRPSKPVLCDQSVS